ncbi:type II toxin -antitoxin system TacA 1-like antitoxin [Streptomyces mirabilis]|uniref:type II toxin -antitoxin system TacA 1-like antitoxin n=1 Tax=Streptomyces mirabilis TaxID=68239 RepID=UPI00382E6C76
MDLAQAQALSAPLTAAEHDQVQRAAAIAGQSMEEFVRAAVLDAATDPFLDALERAADTVAARARTELIQHNYAEA